MTDGEIATEVGKLLRGLYKPGIHQLLRNDQMYMAAIKCYRAGYNTGMLKGASELTDAYYKSIKDAWDGGPVA